MKIKHIIIESEQFERLDELAMNPKSLRAMAADTGAIAGMEFEMIVRNSELDYDDYEQKMDMDYDDYAKSIDHVCDFYSGDYNNRSTIRELRNTLTDEYYEWRSQSIYSAFESKQKELLEKYVRENEIDVDDSIQEKLEEMGLSSQELKVALLAGKQYEEYLNSDDQDKQLELFGDSKEGFKNYKKALDSVQEEIDEMVNDAIHFKDRVWNSAFEEYEEYEADEFTEDEWFEDNNTERLSDFVNKYDVMWPYWIEPSSDESNLEAISEMFGKAIKRPVNYATEYHNAYREEGTYTIEPDGSIEPDSGGIGLEFISPPLPLDQMISDLNKVIKWAKDNDCYTNESTGLHMNISIPDVHKSNLDFVKLLLLSGDRYVLEQFGRDGNFYCKDALSKISDTASGRPDLVSAVLDQMKTKLNTRASSLLKHDLTDKYSSINLSHKDYIEVRSPGGDWLNSNISMLENTLLRYVVAYDAACRPEKFRKDYLKKLYSLLNVSSNNDILYYFANFAAGELDKNSLIRIVRREREERGRTANKLKFNKPSPSNNNTMYNWLVSVNGMPSSNTTVVAKNGDEAKQIALNSMQEWKEQGRHALELNATALGPYIEGN
jgi:hypothetical protein